MPGSARSRRSSSNPSRRGIRRSARGPAPVRRRPRGPPRRWPSCGPSSAGRAAGSGSPHVGVVVDDQDARGADAAGAARRAARCPAPSWPPRRARRPRGAPRRGARRLSTSGAPKGRPTVNVLPVPGSLATETVPPCSAASSCTRARPIPVPSGSAAAARTRWKRWNSCGSSSATMPTPVSVTVSAKPSASERRATSIPPTNVYLTALASRLTTTFSHIRGST